jgi:hypothetical protein
MNRIKVDPNDLAWRPAHEVWPEYRLEGANSGSDPYGAGIFVKVLRRPDDGGGCWCVLLRFTPPPEKAIRVTAVASSDEEVLILSDQSETDRSGSFTCNPAGLRHGNTFTGETVAFVHYHAEPDQVLKAELVELADVRG